MIRLAIVSEGRTEKTFVDQVLAPHLQDREVFAVARWCAGAAAAAM